MNLSSAAEATEFIEDTNQMGSVTLGLVIGGGPGMALSVPADPACNFFIPNQEKYCKEPFHWCSHHVLE
ncbi:MAG: hypothetical protein R3C59_09120 [Planctomycetaceae bacterium]